MRITSQCSMPGRGDKGRVGALDNSKLDHSRRKSVDGPSRARYLIPSPVNIIENLAHRHAGSRRERNPSVSLLPSANPPVSAAVRSAAELLPLLDAVAAAMTARGYLARDIFGMRLAMEEVLVNALKHGHGYDPSKQARVRYHVTEERVVAEVEDEGPGFDPEAVADPLDPENLERCCGRGLLLMRHYLTSFRYNERGNAVTLCKCRSC